MAGFPGKCCLKPGSLSSPRTHTHYVGAGNFYAGARTSDFALIPHLRRHILAASARLNGKNRASEWIRDTARESVGNPVRYHEVFSTNYFIVLGVAVYPCAWPPTWRTNYLNCGSCFRDVAFYGKRRPGTTIARRGDGYGNWLGPIVRMANRFQREAEI